MVKEADCEVERNLEWAILALRKQGLARATKKESGLIASARRLQTSAPDHQQHHMSPWDCFSSSLATAFAPRASSSSPAHVDLLLLGSGWTSTFVLPLAADAGLSTAFTTRAGGGGSIQWQFDPKSDDVESFRVLPDATTVLIVFPVYEEGGIERLVRGYLESRGQPPRYYDDVADEKASSSSVRDEFETSFVLLGSTGIYDVSVRGVRGIASQADVRSLVQNGPTFAPLDVDAFKKHPRHPHKGDSPWIDESSPYVPLPRALSEDKLLALSKPNNAVRAKPIATSVLLLCGLWGHGRSVRNYLLRLPGDKNVVRNMGSVHFVHGRDVGRAVVAMAKDGETAKGKRWILTNERL